MIYYNNFSYHDYLMFNLIKVFKSIYLCIMAHNRNFACSLLKMKSTGLHDRIKNSWSLVKANQVCSQPPFRAMGISQMRNGFFLLLIGFSIAVVILIAEMGKK